MRTIAILCGGGPAPGINTVVATVTKVFLKAGFRVLGIHEGYKGLLNANPDIEELTFEKADRMFTRGGSLIRMSRFKPRDTDFNTELFVKYGIELLVTVGGDDTASTANRLTKFLAAHQIQVRNIHVPKTIDNDLPLPEGVPTFGFMSAKEMGIHIGKVIKAEAATTQNWYVLMSMGREAGHLAFEIGKGIQSAMIVIPEMFEKTEITVDKVVRLVISAMVKRRLLGQKSGVAVISEGIFHFLKKGMDAQKANKIESAVENYTKVTSLNSKPLKVQAFTALAQLYFNNGAGILQKATPFANSDKEKYAAEKAKAETSFKKAEEYVGQLKATDPENSVVKELAAQIKAAMK